MKPVQFVAAVSQNWTFHGPGASGQAAANWLAGFGRGPTPPTLLGIRQNANTTNWRLLVLDEFKMEKKNQQNVLYNDFSLLNLVGPLPGGLLLESFARGPVVPGGISNSCCLDEFCPSRNQSFCLHFSNRELRRCFQLAPSLLQKIQVTKGNLTVLYEGASVNLLALWNTNLLC